MSAPISAPVSSKKTKQSQPAKRTSVLRHLPRALPKVPVSKRSADEPERDPPSTYRIPGDPGRPPRVSRKAWAAVFPPDRQAVFSRAAVLVRQGYKPDEATRLAADDVADAALVEGSTILSKVVLTLLPAFGADGRGERGHIRIELLALAERVVRGLPCSDLKDVPEVIRPDVERAFEEATSLASRLRAETEASLKMQPHGDDPEGLLPDPDDPSTYMDLLPEEEQSRREAARD